MGAQNFNYDNGFRKRMVLASNFAFGRHFFDKKDFLTKQKMGKEQTCNCPTPFSFRHDATNFWK